MKTLFKAVMIYGIASAVVAWFGLLFITIANLVFALAGAISMGVNIFQNFAAGVILLLLTILLFLGMKLLFGVAKSGMAMAKAMGSAGKLGMPKGGVGNMLKGLGRLDPRSLRDAGNMANKLGGRKAGKLLNKGADMKSGLDEARELNKISGKKNTGKISKKKQKELAAARSKKNNDLDRASKDKKYRDKVKSSMLLDEDGKKKTGEELSKAEKEADQFDLDAQRAGKFRELFPELGERMHADEINDLLDGELPNYDKRRLGIGDDKMDDITTRMERGHFTDGLGVNTDNDYKKIAEETGGIAKEHKSVEATDSKELQEKNEETRAHDEKSNEIANRLNESHSEEKEANRDTPGEDTSQKAMNVSQTVNEHKNATLNGSENSNSPEAVISNPEKEKDIASGANDLPVDKSTAADNARRTSVEIDNLTSSAPGMPEGTTIDENGESLRNQLMSRDEGGNIISSIEDDEIARAGETAARGDAIRGTVLPKEVTDSGDFSDENIERATSGNTQEYISGMNDQSVADALNDREVSGATGSDNVSDIVGDQSVPSTSQGNVNDILSTDSTSSMSSDDLMSSIDASDRETVESSRGDSTAASSLNQENIGLPSSMDTGQPVSGSTDQSDPVASDQSFDSNSSQSDDPVANAFQTLQRNRQRYEQNQQGNAQAGFAQTNYGASGRESVGSDQGTPDYIDRPAQQNQYGPTEKYLTDPEPTMSDQEIVYTQGGFGDEVGPTMDPLYSDQYYENRDAKPEARGEWNQAAFIQDYQNNNPNVAPQQSNVAPQQPVQQPNVSPQQPNVSPQQPNVAPQQPNVAPQQPVQQPNVDNTQQFTDPVPEQANTNEDIMNSIIGDQQQPQPSRETPIAPSQQANGHVPQAQQVSGSGYTNIPQNPLVNNDGFYGDRDVRLSPESMFLMGQILDNAGQDRDANLRKDMNEMNRRTEGRINSQIDQLSHQFEDDLRESGKYTEDEIRGEVAGMSEALKRAMERKDDFADEQDQAKMTGNMTNQGNTGKIKRPDNR